MSRLVMGAPRGLLILLVVVVELLLGGCLTTGGLRTDLDRAKEDLRERQAVPTGAEEELRQAEQELARAEAEPAARNEALDNADTHLTRAEALIVGERFPVETYKSNFFLFFTHDRSEHPERKSTEAKFQISLKKKITCDRERNCWDWVNTFLPLYFGYTQKSFWQIYDKQNSSPFRENNYNPEFFLDYRDSLLKGTPFGLAVGLFEHESNGQSSPLSRSWNRSYLRGSYLGGRVRAEVKVWERWAEEPQEDDNPQIERFLGNWETTLELDGSARRNSKLVAFFRPGAGFDYPTVQLDYLYHLPFLNEGVFLQLHVFDGYGESLIDYDTRVRKVGIGFAIHPADPLAGANGSR